MAQHNDVGRLGEDLAAAYLEQQGYTVIARNWRHSRYEIDTIAEKAGRLFFIEVKMRSGFEYGAPEESVTPKKIRYLLKAIEAFLDLHPAHTDFRLNILAITTNSNSETTYCMIEDVYTW